MARGNKRREKGDNDNGHLQQAARESFGSQGEVGIKERQEEEEASAVAAAAKMQVKNTSLEMAAAREQEQQQELQNYYEEDDDDEEERYLVGFVEVTVVGLQYYDGTVNNREMVRLVREPHNPYDCNAIRVDNMRGQQVGHVERRKACFLAPMADDGSLTMEGIIPRGSKNTFRMPCHVFLFSPYHLMDTVFSSLFSYGLPVVSPSDPQFHDYSAMAMSPSSPSTTTTQHLSVDQIFDSLLQTPPSSSHFMLPSPLITTPLYPHQQQALAWLVQRENSNDLPPFWQQHPPPGEEWANGRLSFINTLTNFMTPNRPKPFRGGILADEMGLGKTLTLVSLIATNSPGSLLPPIQETVESTSSTRPLKRQKCTELAPQLPTSNLDSNCSRSTLVVCPLSVVSIWISQLEEHTHVGSLNVYLYHGPERTKKSSVLSSFDIVLTTYNILAVEGDNARSPLQKVNWLRVILDEAHLVKNPNARQTKAAVSLKAERRWAVTGTPIQNGAKDLCSLMMFLKLQPLDEKSFWNRTIQRPLLSGDASGYLRLQALLMAIALRRTKDMKVHDKRIVDLPPKTVTVYYVELSQEDRQLYDKVEWEGKQLVGRYLASGIVLQNYSTVLQILLRLRQICDHSSLCPLHESFLETLSNAGDMSASPELLQKLLSVLQSGDDFDCPICLSAPTMAIITKCSHVFCRRCIEKTLMHDKKQCPLCRAPLTSSDLFSSPVVESTDSSGSEMAQGSSAKINALIELLTHSRENDPTVKSVVFSQFSGMLNLVGGPLEAAGFNYVRVDGSMSMKRREAALKEFVSKKSGSPSVILLSLKAAGVGLNLVAASRVYMLDPWWNPAVEEQAMDRVHRLGQKRDVEIIRLIVKDSIEERILEMQEKKRNLASSAFEKSTEDMQKMRIKDVQLLMQL